MIVHLRIDQSMQHSRHRRSHRVVAAYIHHQQEGPIMKEDRGKEIVGGSLEIPEDDKGV